MNAWEKIASFNCRQSSGLGEVGRKYTRLFVFCGFSDCCLVLGSSFISGTAKSAALAAWFSNSSDEVSSNEPQQLASGRRTLSAM
jgi:hypothetical protein